MALREEEPPNGGSNPQQSHSLITITPQASIPQKRKYFRPLDLAISFANNNYPTSG